MAFWNSGRRTTCHACSCTDACAAECTDNACFSYARKTLRQVGFTSYYAARCFTKSFTGHFRSGAAYGSLTNATCTPTYNSLGKATDCVLRHLATKRASKGLFDVAVFDTADGCAHWNSNAACNGGINALINEAAIKFTDTA